MIISINNRVLELVQHLHPEVVILERVKYVSAVNATHCAARRCCRTYLETSGSRTSPRRARSTPS
jgi:hypothetical protein